MPRATPACVLFALIETGCPDSHWGDGGQDVDGGSPLLDSGEIPRDAQIGADGGEVDAGFVPVRCDGTPECYCFAEDTVHGPSYRLTPLGEPIAPCEVGSGCDRDGWLCNDLGWGERLGVDWHRGVCVQTGVCAWQRAHDSRTWCYYEDGSFYSTGELAREACEDVDRNVVCGPACGGCDAPRTCVGVSERSGLGLCIRGTPADSPDRCGPMHDACGEGLGCVGFVLADGVSFAAPQSVWHSCVSREACDRLQARYPDRFRCTR